MAALPKSPAEEAKARLHPLDECWVHVKYDGYRDAYFGFGLHASPGGFLDRRRRQIGAR